MKRIYRFPVAGVRNLHRRRAGSSLVEFAVVSMLFFTLVFGLIDLGHVFFVQMTMQHALREAGRYAVTGNHEAGTNPNTSQPYTRAESIVKAAQKAASGTGITTTDIDISHSGTATGTFVGGTGVNAAAGGPSEFVRVSLTANVPLFTPLIGQFFGSGGVYTFTVSTTFRNEPFDPKNTV